MKVKVFKFEVSNASSSAFADDRKQPWYINARNRLNTPEEIEDEINEFCEGKSIVRVEINTVDVHHHNNGRGNTVELWYTIMYI